MRRKEERQTSLRKEVDRYVHACGCGYGNREWTITNISALALQQLGDIYCAGGLAKVTRLDFGNAMLTKASMRAWMDGVLALEHRGAALERLEFWIGSGTSEDVSAASQVLVEALRAGAFPNLQTLKASTIVQEEKLEFMGGEHFWASFIQAIGDGAPCARTLRSLWVDATLSEEEMTALQTVFPQVKISSLETIRARIVGTT
jgi:hypothetical protein